MRAVLVSVEPGFLEKRRRLGIDGFDEEWAGELHVNPPPGGYHQQLSSRLFLAFAPLAERGGLAAQMETGVFRPGVHGDYRVPDSAYFAPELLSTRGVEGAASLVVEIRSPDDESYAKLPFYADLGIADVLTVHPGTRRVELFHRTDDGGSVLVQPDPDRGVELTALGVWCNTVATAAGPRLRLTAADGALTDI